MRENLFLPVNGITRRNKYGLMESLFFFHDAILAYQQGALQIFFIVLTGIEASSFINLTYTKRNNKANKFKNKESK